MCLCQYVAVVDFSFFAGDQWGEIDTRFSFCAVASLALVGRLWSNCPINIDACVEFILSCMNFDGGFGCRPGSETHSGQVRKFIFTFKKLVLVNGYTTQNSFCVAA